MSGKTELFNFAILFFSLIALFSDLARGRIFNWLTLPMVISGILLSTLLSGWAGLGSSLGGLVVGFALFGWLFWLRAIGGGDVKLLMGLGAWGGVKYTVDTAILSILLGGAMAIILLIARGRFADFSRRLYRFLLTVFVKELQLEAPRIDKKFKMPFGVPLVCAAIWTAFSGPLERWGIHLW